MKIEYQSDLTPILEKLDKKINELIDKNHQLEAEVNILRSKLGTKESSDKDLSVYAP